VLWPLLIGNRKKLKLTTQCFDTFRGFLHKHYAATMDGKSREGTYNFSHDDWGAAGAEHREGQLSPATPLAPPMYIRCVK